MTTNPTTTTNTTSTNTRSKQRRVETTPLVVWQLTCHDQNNDTLLSLRDLLIQRLQQEGILVLQQQQRQHPNSVLLLLTATQSVLEQTAERIHLLKPKHCPSFRVSNNNNNNNQNDWTIMERFTVAERHLFVQGHSKRSNSSSSDGPCQELFTSQEVILLLYRLLDGLPIVSLPCQEIQSTKDDTDNNDTSSLLLRLLQQSKDNNNNTHKKQHQQPIQASSLLQTSLQAQGYLLKVMPVHDSSIKNSIWQTTLYGCVDSKTTTTVSKTFTLSNRLWKIWKASPPIDMIHDYYGANVAFYFAWMNFLSKWYLVPGILGLFVFTLRWIRNDTIDEDEYTPLYGLVTFVWAILLVRFWQRYEYTLSYRWGTFSLTHYERQKYLAKRPTFWGTTVRTSPITGEPELYFPTFRRQCQYFLSALITIIMLTIAFGIMIVSLNVQGYIRPQSNPTRWTNQHPHPFYVASAAQLSELNQWFDASSWWRSMIPVVLHVACIFVLNTIYRHIAEQLTEWENHETQVDHRNSLVLKRFLFEAFDCYVALFYLAFYERNVERLRSELIAVYQIDTLRRLLMECVIPLFLQRYSRKQWNDPSKNKGPDSKSSTTIKAILEDLEKDEYERFDDLMEIVIQFGYITLFASAYPLASLVSVLSNWIEIRADCFKLSFLCQRPVPLRSSDLGMWDTLLSSLVWMSALTNCLLAGFTSNQLMYYLPTFYVPDHSGFTTMEHDRGWLVVFLIFGLERLLLLVGLLLCAIVPPIPEDVTNQMERYHYVQSEVQKRIDARKATKKTN